MELLYHNRNRREDLEKELGARHVSLDRLLRESDFVSIHTPLTPETSGIIGEERIITCLSGTYEWNHPDMPSVLVFDKDGRVKASDFDFTVEAGAGEAQRGGAGGGGQPFYGRAAGEAQPQ